MPADNDSSDSSISAPSLQLRLLLQLRLRPQLASGNIATVASLRCDCEIPKHVALAGATATEPISLWHETAQN